MKTLVKALKIVILIICIPIVILETYVFCLELKIIRDAKNFKFSDELPLHEPLSTNDQGQTYSIKLGHEYNIAGSYIYFTGLSHHAGIFSDGVQIIKIKGSKFIHKSPAGSCGSRTIVFLPKDGTLQDHIDQRFFIREKK